MNNLIETLDEGLRVAQKVLATYLADIENLSVRGHDLSALTRTYIDSLPPMNQRSNKQRLLAELSRLIRNIRNLKSHDNTKHDSLVQDSYFISVALEIIRRFIKPLIEDVNARGRSFLNMPEFLHGMNQPDGSRHNPVLDWKSKSFDYVTTRKAPFDLSESDIPFTRQTVKEILVRKNYFNPGTRFLMTRTVGDIFLFDRYRKGYSGDWEDATKKGENIDKIIVVHFFEGDKSSKAHVYLADFVDRKYQTIYRIDQPPRYRYFFKNLMWCGEIRADFTKDFHSTKFFSV